MKRLLFLSGLLACAGCTAQDRADFKANFHPELIGSAWANTPDYSTAGSNSSGEEVEHKLDAIDRDLQRLSETPWQRAFDGKGF